MLGPGQLQRLDTLIPEARQAFDALVQAMTGRGLEPFIGQCGRTPAQQAQAIKDGTTSKTQKVSWHELNRAVDFRARLHDGTEDLTTSNEAFFQALYQEVQKIEGLRSLAYNQDGTKLLLNGHTWDAGHVEFRTPYDTLAQAVQAEAPELAATHVEQEASKVVTEVKSEAHALVTRIQDDAKAITDAVEKSKLITELMALVTRLRAEAAATSVPVDPAVTQAQLDAIEDKAVIEGLASRILHRLWSLV